MNRDPNSFLWTLALLRADGPRWVAIALLVLALSPTGLALPILDELDAARQFDEANQVFLDAETPEEFAEAAAMFQAIVDQGMVGSAVLFNLGNSWMRSGRPGRAIAAYSQAQRFAPRDPILESNLAMARAAAGTTAPEPSWSSRVVFWQSWTSATEKARAVTGLLALAILLGLAGQLRGGNGLRTTALLALGLTMLIGVSLGMDVIEHREGSRGVVAVPDAVTRKGAAESYAEAFTEPLVEGTEFRVRERDREWVHIELADGLDGWLPTDAVVLW